MPKNKKTSGKRLLFVEDNELNQEIAVTILEEAGFVVEVAEDGRLRSDQTDPCPQ